MLLSIVMMVKNEEEYLERCLEALNPILSKISSELIVLDTGSTDNTVKIAKKFTSKVYFEKWNNNFSEMRNKSIKYATGEWIFIIDADEILENEKEIVSFFGRGKYKNFNTGFIKVKNYTKKEKFNILYLPRLFKNNESFKYEGAIHEQPTIIKPVHFFEIQLNHFGYNTEDKELMKRKFLRNSEILQKELKINPQNIYYWHQLSQTYNAYNHTKEALEAAEKAYNLAKEKKVNLSNMMYLYNHLALIYYQQKKYYELEKICKEGIETKSGYIDLYYFLGVSYMDKYDYDKAIKNYDYYLKLIDNYDSFPQSKDSTVTFYTLDIKDHVYKDLTLIYNKTENYEKVLDYSKKIKDTRALQGSFENIVESFIRLEKYEDVLKYYEYLEQNFPEKIVERFIGYLEAQLTSLDITAKKIFGEYFSKEKNSYGYLNKIRNSISNKIKDEKFETFSIDFQNLPRYYADILYYYITNDIKLSTILEKTREERIYIYLDYLKENYSRDFMDKTKKYILNKEDSIDISEKRVIKILSHYMILFNEEIEDDIYNEVFRRYIAFGIEYLSLIYNSNIFKNEEIEFVKNDEEAFLIYIENALVYKEKDKIKYVRQLKKALKVYPIMKKGIEILMKEITGENSINKLDSSIEENNYNKKDKIKELINSGFIEEATNLVNDYSKKALEDPEIYSIKGILSMIKGEMKEAHDFFEKGLKIDQKNFDILYNLGYLYDFEGKENEAIKYYQKALRTTNDKAIKKDIINILKNIKEKNIENNTGIESTKEKTLSETPQAKLKTKIQHLIETGLLKEAKIALEKYENAIDEDTAIYSFKGVIALIEGDINYAEKILKEGLVIDNQNFDLLYNLSYLYEFTNELIVSYRYYKKTLSNTNTGLAKNIQEKIRELEDNEIIKEYLKRKKVLIIAYAFPPIGGSGIQRTLKFVKYLRNFNWEPVVLTVGNTSWNMKDQSLLEEIPKDIEVIRIDDIKKEEIDGVFIEKLINFYSDIILNKKIFKEYLNILKKNPNDIGKYLFIPEYQSGWAMKVCEKVENYVNFEEIELIYTTADPYANTFIGNFIKKKYNKLWIADFRDEWTNHHYKEYDENSIHYKMEYEMENTIINSADKILTTSELSTTNYINIFGLNSDKVLTITNGYDENDFYGIEQGSNRNKSFKIMHNGIFHDGKNPKTFLKALSNLRKKNLIDANEFKVYFTREDIYIDLVNSLELQDFVEYLGYLEHKKSLEIASECDVLLLIVGEGEKLKQVHAAKLFEYLRLGKPIFSLAPKQGVIDDLINELNRGYNVGYEDITEIENHILKLYGDWKNNKLEKFNLTDDIKKFERKALTEKLSGVFSELAKQDNIKKQIKSLLEKGEIIEAKKLFNEYEAKNKTDIERYSINGVIAMLEGNLEEAESFLKHGLSKNNKRFDLLYNLAYLYQFIKKNDLSIEYYKQALEATNNSEEIEAAKRQLKILNIEDSEETEVISLSNRKKIVIFSKGDDKFIGDIINGLAKSYEVKKITISNNEEFKLIDQWMKWADISWFEWCDELVIYGSKLPMANEKKIICRIHGYEVYTNYIKQANWKNINNLIIVAPHIRRIFEENTKDIDKGNLRVDTVFCGIELNKYPILKKSKGFNLGYLGYVNFKKNIPLTLDIFKKLHDIDNRYKLHIAGEFQDIRTYSYLKYFLREHKLENAFFFYGWLDQQEKVKWFEKIDYMIVSSIDEGLCFAAAEAMTSGIKPVLHNCEGIKDHYNKKYIFNTIDQATEMILNEEYNSMEYRDFIRENYSLDKEMTQINQIIERVSKLQEQKDYYDVESNFNYKIYWEKRYQNGGNSGSGSYNKLAKFKAETINVLIRENTIKNVIEFGCGDGNQLQYMEYENYIGLDISPTVIKRCQKRFKNDMKKIFKNYTPGQLNDKLKVQDMVVCLDVLYHIIDEEDFIRTLDDIFSIAAEFIVIYTILDEPKTVYSAHIKYRNILEYLNKYKNYSIHKIVKQKYTDESLADFIILKKKVDINKIHLIDDTIKSINDFSYINKELINAFDFSNCSISIGKIEVISSNYLLIEYIVSNASDKQLVITGILLDDLSNNIIYPEYISKSAKAEDIDMITKRVIQLEKNKIGCFRMHGFIYNQQIIKDIESDKLAYNWERAIPGTQFMPLAGYLNVILRYELAKNYISKSDYVLEAGSGFGYGAAYLSSICKKVEALDIAQENIEFGKKTYNFENINWVEGDVTNLPYRDNTFDVYITYETLEHIPLNLVEAYLREASRVLKKKGKLIISTPNRINRKNVNNPFHIKEYNVLEFDNLLKKYFKNVEYCSIEGNTLSHGISNDSKVMIAIASN